MSFQDILQWWNLIYAIPLLVSVVWIVATVMSGAHGGEIGHASHGAGHDFAHGVGHAAHDVAHSVGHVLHHHGHGDVGHGHDADHHHEGHHHEGGNNENLVSRILFIFGIGQIPITLLVGIFMLCWGAFGLFVNEALAGSRIYPAIYIWPSLAITFGSSAIFTRLLVAVFKPLIPRTETYGVSRLELVGSLGHTVYTTTSNSGTVNVKDQYGTVHRVQAKTESDVDSLPAGTEVMIVDFDDDDKRFVVSKSTI